MSEFGRVWDYHRDFEIIHFGNADQVPEPEPVEDEPEPPKKPRFLKQPKGWFRR